MSRAALIYFSIILFTLIGCSRGYGTKNSVVAKKDGYKAEYAEKFEINKRATYTILDVKNPWQGAENVKQRYWLVKRGAGIPDGIDSNYIIRTPVKKIICMSTTHLAMISALHEENSVKAISGSDYLYKESLYEKIASGEIKDVGYEDNLNKELVIKIAPDLIMVYGVGSESSGYLGKLKELGVKILYNADYLETDPLGKAEWIKVFGALYCREDEADSIFIKAAREYNEIKSYVRQNITSRPTVLLGLPWKDTWFVSPGNSNISGLISDAGGEYIWKTTKSEISMPYGIENVFMKALKADFWLNTGTVNTRSEILAMDNRLGELPSFKKGNIYNNNNRISPRGGNDYWESGIVNPQIILKDIASLFHPDLFPGYKPFFYKKIE
jgi:iron complex transport system substrate-binding protein